MTSTSKQRPDANKLKKKMSKEQLHLALTKKRECDAKALAIVVRMIETEVDQTWLLENLEHINRSHMEDVVEERAILKRCGYALCDNPLKLNITQKYHISTRSNKVYDVSRRKNFCSNNCYGAGNFILEQLLTSPLWLRDPKHKSAFQLLSVSGLSRKSTPGDEVDLGRESIGIDPNKSHDKTEAVNPEDVQEGKDFLNENSTSDEHCEIGNERELKRLKERLIPEGLLEPEDKKECNKIRDVELIVEKTDEGDIPVANFNQKVEKTSTTEPKVSKERQHRKRREKNELTQEKFDANWLVERIERYLREWITIDSLVLLLGDPTLKQDKIEKSPEGLRDEEVRRKYTQLCQKVNSLQIDRDSDDEENKTVLKPLPDYGSLKEESKKLEIKVKAFFEGRTAIETPSVSSAEPSGKEMEDSSTFFPTLSEKEPKLLRRRIVLEKLDKVLPEMLRTLAGGEFVVNECIGNNGCGKTVKALVNTFSLSAGNVIPKPAEWNLLGVVFIKLLSISEPRLRFLLKTERARKYITMILMSYNLEPNYLDGLVATVTDVESYRKKNSPKTEDLNN